MGLPGFIDTPLKCFLNPQSSTSLGIKSYFPAEIAPEVTNKLISELIKSFSDCLNFSGSSSLMVPPSMMIIV